MLQLIRIIYISRSTFKRTNLKSVIEPNVGRILGKSRINNRRNGLVGVLYFGDGCFFQCLEGEESAIDRLYATLEADDRHKDLKLLSREFIGAPTYTDWAMKFVPVEKEMSNMLKEGGFTSFDPYLFDGVMVRKVMNLLRTSVDPTTEAVVEASIQKSMAAPASAKASPVLWLVAVVVIAAVVAAAIFLLRR